MNGRPGQPTERCRVEYPRAAAPQPTAEQDVHDRSRHRRQSLRAGARPGDLEAIDARPGAWLLDQLRGPARLPAEIRGLPDSASVLVEVRELRREQRDRKRAGREDDIVEKYGRVVRHHYVEQTAARYASAARTDVPFFERLVHFWSNHFAISADKQTLPAIAGRSQHRRRRAGCWDTHANQGAGEGALANRFATLDAGLELLAGLGDAWASTAVAAVTEFGRTVRVNGTRGTDHGTATAAVLLGGAVNGGRVIADWPGLTEKDLYDGRDLRATTDLRGVFKGLLIGHLGLAPSRVEREVFPGNGSAPPLDGRLAV